MYTRFFYNRDLSIWTNNKSICGRTYGNLGFFFNKNNTNQENMVFFSINLLRSHEETINWSSRPSRVNDKCSLRIYFIHAHGMVYIYIIEQCGNLVDLVPIVKQNEIG